MRVFISYHRADRKYRKKVENILDSHNIEYYAVSEDENFDGLSNEYISNFICQKVKSCDVLINLIGRDTYSRPHVDREIHTALKGGIGDRLGIIAVILNNRTDSLNNLDKNTISKKLLDNKEYVVWTNYNDLNSDINDLLDSAYDNSNDRNLTTNHSNSCMKLRSKKYYDN